MHNIDKLIDMLIKESIIQEEVTKLGESKKMSKQSIKLYEIKEELRAYGSKACEKLIQSLNIPNNYVRFNVAHTLLSIDQEKARITLMEIASLTGTIAFKAEMILQQLDEKK